MCHTFGSGCPSSSASSALLSPLSAASPGASSSGMLGWAAALLPLCLPAVLRFLSTPPLARLLSLVRLPLLLRLPRRLPPFDRLRAYAVPKSELSSELSGGCDKLLST